MSEITVQSQFPFSAVPRVWSWISEFKDRVSDDFGAKTLDEFVALWESRAQRSWAVYRDGELGGVVTFENWTPKTGAAHCIFKRSFWGWETTLPALKEIARQGFDSGIHKVLFFVFSDNNAIISLLKRLGARREGLLRQQTFRNGKPVDMALFGLLKEDFDGLQRGRIEPEQHQPAVPVRDQDKDPAAGAVERPGASERHDTGQVDATAGRPRTAQDAGAAAGQ